MEPFDLFGDGTLHACARRRRKITAPYFFTESDLNKVNFRGETPVVTAVRERAHSTLRDLLRMKPNLDISDQKGNTALHYAVREEDVLSVRQLCAAGANPTIYNSKGESTIHLAAAAADPRIFYALRKASPLVQINIDAPNREGDSPLHIAVKKQLIRTSGTLLSASANRHSLDKAGDTPLHIAVKLENLYLTRHLLSIVAIKHRNSVGDTPIMIAAKQGNGEIFRTLLINQSQLIIVDQAENSLLHLAAIPSSTLILHFLLERHKPQQEPKNKEGETPLHFACLHNNLAAARTLIAYGAKINTVNQLGQTPFMAAVQNQNIELCELLFSPPYVNATLSLNSQDGWGNTALHMSAETNSIPIARLILRYGGNAQLRNRKKETAADILKRKHGRELPFDILPTSFPEIGAWEEVRTEPQ